MADVPSKESVDVDSDRIREFVSFVVMSYDLLGQWAPEIDATSAEIRESIDAHRAKVAFICAREALHLLVLELQEIEVMLLESE